MPKKRDIQLFFTDICEAIDNIKEYIRDMDYDKFVQDKKTRDAVIRCLEVIGEAAKNVPDEVKEKHPKIKWKKMAGMRDKLIHEYFGVSCGIAWDTVQNDIPIVERQIKKILEKSREP